MSVATRAISHAAVVLFVTLAGAGCGKYGKPVRQPPEPSEHVFRRADGSEKRYTFTASETDSRGVLPKEKGTT